MSSHCREVARSAWKLARRCQSIPTAFSLRPRTYHILTGSPCHAVAVPAPTITVLVAWVDPARLSLPRWCESGHLRNRKALFSDVKDPNPSPDKAEGTEATDAVKAEASDDRDGVVGSAAAAGGDAIGGGNGEDAKVGVEKEEVDKSQFNHEIKFRMPDLGDVGEEDGIVLKWYKNEGDIIKQGDKLCDVKTELFEFGMESDDEGITIMGKILVPEGADPVKPGEVLCSILHKHA